MTNAVAIEPSPEMTKSSEKILRELPLDIERRRYLIEGVEQQVRICIPFVLSFEADDIFVSMM